MKKVETIQNRFRLLIALVACLCCSLLLPSCAQFSYFDKADLNFFPETVGTFKRQEIHPSGSSGSGSGEYQNSFLLPIRYTYFKDTNLPSDGGEVLFKAGQVSVAFIVTDQINFRASNGKDVFSASGSNVEQMNEWVNSFPYEKFGIQPPPLPIKIELPPANKKTVSKAAPDLEKKAKEVANELIKLWLDVYKNDGQVKISTLDPTTIIVSNFRNKAPTDEQIKDFVKDTGGNFKRLNFRQIMIGKTVYELPDSPPPASETKKSK